MIQKTNVVFITLENDSDHKYKPEQAVQCSNTSITYSSKVLHCDVKEFNTTTL